VTLSTYEEEFQQFPSELMEAFREAKDAVTEVLSEEDVAIWADSGLSIARRAGRSWEAAKEYFKASPAMVKALPFAHLNSGPTGAAPSPRNPRSSLGPTSRRARRWSSLSSPGTCRSGHSLVGSSTAGVDEPVRFVLNTLRSAETY